MLPKTLLGVVAVLLLLAAPRAAFSQAQTATKEVTLQDAIKVRTDVTLVREEVGELPEEVRGPMRKVVAKGEAKEMEGNILLTKDKYAEAVAAFDESAAFYRQALGGKKVLQRLAAAESKAARAKLLAEASAPAEKTADANRLLVNAEGYVEAAEFEAAIAELEKARKAYEALLAPGAPVTLEQVVAARTAMLSARKLVKGLSPSLRPEGAAPTGLERPAEEAPGLEAGVSRKGSRRGSLPDLLSRAQSADLAAAEALQQREYTPALALFQTAEKLYRQAAAQQVKREAVAAALQATVESMKVADKAFSTEGRPASFERGKQALEDGNKALEDEDLDTAKQRFGEAAEMFAKAQAEAQMANELAKAQEGWSGALAKADEALMARHAADAFDAAKKKAEAADAQGAAGNAQAAIALYQEAVTELGAAMGDALTKENLAKAAPYVERLEAAIARKDNFAAEDLLVEVEKLIPKDPRVPGLRKSVEAVPGLKKSVAIDLGGGVVMEFLLIRPGVFIMGDAQGGDDEKPVHEVKITKPFYLGKYEVTQEQWQAVMGTNPSNFKGAKRPVEDVSWDDCQGFCAKLGTMFQGAFRPPTEAEWEYACRAGTTTKFCCGDDEQGLADYAWCSVNAQSTTHDVAQKKPNAWGLYDMHGNVWEWCADWYESGYYGASPSDDPQGPSVGSIRVIRGGSWGHDPAGCRSADRGSNSPGSRSNYLGLRVSRVLAE